MKYNVVKKMQKAKSFEFILRGVGLDEAQEKLSWVHANQMGRMFADITSIIDYEDNTSYFEVHINGETITYEIEQDQFFTWGEIFRPATFGKRSLETINYN